MTEILITPDVEALLISTIQPVLNVQYAGVKVGTISPIPVPQTFVRVQRAGSVAGSNIVSEGTYFLLEVFSELEQDAVNVIEFLRGFLHSLEGVLFGVWDVGGVVNLTDPSLPTHKRYTCTIGARVRKNSLNI